MIPMMIGVPQSPRASMSGRSRKNPPLRKGPKETMTAPAIAVATNLLFFIKGTPTKEVWYYEHKLPEGQKSYSKTKPIRLEEFNPIREWWNNRKENEVAWRVDIKTIIERGYDLDIKNPNKKAEEHEYTSVELIELLEKSMQKSNELLNQLKSEMK